jgi:quinol monooxygenase YgiN
MRLSGQVRCASAADAAVFAAHLPDHVALTRAETGCLSFVVVPTADPLVWQVDESFVDQAAFDHHQSRTRASDWHRLTAHIPRDFAISPG